jgi:hypothetical protein
VKRFLVEVFMPREQSGALAGAEGRARSAAGRAGIRYVQASYVPEDETCFYVFDAASADLVVRAAALAGLGDGRVVGVTTTDRPPG